MAFLTAAWLAALLAAFAWQAHGQQMRGSFSNQAVAAAISNCDGDGSMAVITLACRAGDVFCGVGFGGSYADGQSAANMNGYAVISSSDSASADIGYEATLQPQTVTRIDPNGLTCAVTLEGTLRIVKCTGTVAVATMLALGSNDVLYATGKVAGGALQYHGFGEIYRGIASLTMEDCPMPAQLEGALTTPAGFEFAVSNCACADVVVFGLTCPAGDNWCAVGMGGDYELSGNDKMNGYAVATASDSHAGGIGFEPTLVPGYAYATTFDLLCAAVVSGGVREVTCARAFSSGYDGFAEGDNALIYATGASDGATTLSQHGGDTAARGVDVMELMACAGAGTPAPPRALADVPPSMEGSFANALVSFSLSNCADPSELVVTMVCPSGTTYCGVGVGGDYTLSSMAKMNGYALLTAGDADADTFESTLAPGAANAQASQDIACTVTGLSGGMRTVTCTRPFDTGDAEDYAGFTPGDHDVIYAQGDWATPYPWHGAGNRGTDVLPLGPCPTPPPTGRPTTASPTARPSASPTDRPTAAPTDKPTASPSDRPTARPTDKPTASPSDRPTASPSDKPTARPTDKPSAAPTDKPTASPSDRPTARPTDKPSTANPTPRRSEAPSMSPTDKPTTASPTERPTTVPPTRARYRSAPPTSSPPTDRPTTSSPTARPTPAANTTTTARHSEPPTAGATPPPTHHRGPKPTRHRRTPKPTRTERPSAAPRSRRPTRGPGKRDVTRRPPRTRRPTREPRVRTPRPVRDNPDQ